MKPVFPAAALCAALLAAAPAQADWEMPPLDRVLNYQPKQPLQVFTADGVEIAAFGAERRQFVPIAKMPKLLQDAVIAVEDARFREHSGIDADLIHPTDRGSQYTPDDYLALLKAYGIQLSMVMTMPSWRVSSAPCQPNGRI